MTPTCACWQCMVWAHGDARSLAPTRALFRPKPAAAPSLLPQASDTASRIAPKARGTTTSDPTWQIDCGNQVKVIEGHSRNSLLDQIVHVCRAPQLDPMRAEFPVQSAHHMQSQGSHGSGSLASVEPAPRNQQDTSRPAAHPTAPSEEQSTLKPQGHEILDCVTLGMRLALQWHLQHRYPDVWVQVCTTPL